MLTGTLKTLLLFLIHIIFIPIKITYWLFNLLNKPHIKCITLYASPLGHIIYNIKYINRINEPVIVITPRQTYEFVKRSIHNNNIQLFSSTNLSM